MTATLIPSGDTTGATDTAAIAAATAVEGSRTVLLAGDWFTNASIPVASGAELAGEGGAVNGVTSMNPLGTVIHPVAGFPAGDEVITLAAGTRGQRFRDFTISGDLAIPAGVDGFAARGEVDGVSFVGVAVVLVTGHGAAWYQADGVDGDGLWMERCMFQRCGLNAVHRWPNDATVVNVHIQYAGVAGDADLRHGFYSTPSSGGNATFIGCRVDLCRGSGWVLDHKGVYGDAVKLVGCSTERNSRHGVLVDNSSVNADDWRTPVVISGCGFGGDGTGTDWDGDPYGPGGDFAGIKVVGKNRVFVSGTVITVNNVDNPQGAPRFAVAFDKGGGTGSNVESFVFSGGRMNFSTAQGGTGPVENQSYCDHLAIDPSSQYTGDYEDTSPSLRAGKVTLNGSAQATVTSKWAWPRALILATPQANAAGRIYVTNKQTGSFQVKSSSVADSGLDVAWMIAPGP